MHRTLNGFHPDRRRPGARPARMLTVFCSLLAMILVVGCSSKVSDRDIAYVSVEEAFEIQGGARGIFGIGGVNPVWIDPRSSSAYEKAHIPGAVNLSLEEVRADHPLLRDYDTFIVYGNTYNAPIAAAMVKRLIANGYDDVRTLRGGLQAWRDAGNRVEPPAED